MPGAGIAHRDLHHLLDVADQEPARYDAVVIQRIKFDRAEARRDCSRR